MNWQQTICIKTLTSLILLPFWVNPTYGQEPVSFNRDVRPILASKCFACHGPDEDHQEAGLRFDDRQVAIEFGAIVPGKPSESGLVERIFSSDKDDVMPPPHSGEVLNARQKGILKQWVAEGAKYERHWAFEKPTAQPLPEISSSWIRNGIDQFVLSRLETKGLPPNKAAGKYALVRRVYLDLIGLPPTIEQADAFVNSTDAKAYEKLVDQLLASKHYGERWAQPWLDLARYSDTNGYEKDRERSIWPYRDWVIKSLNADLPYDQFTIQQLAGDMLPEPTEQQLIATGFHRNTMLNEEGGIDPLEYRFLAMVDRVATTGTVWLGLTTGCAQCHTHKYDPITHTDYYSLMALMNNADEPDYRIPDPERIAKIETAKNLVAELENDLANQFPPVKGEAPIEERREQNLKAELAKWIKAQEPKVAQWKTITPSKTKTNLPKLELMDDGSIFARGDTTKRDVYELSFQITHDQLTTDSASSAASGITAIRIEAIPDERLPDFGPGKTYYEGRKGDFFLSELTATLNDNPVQFSAASHSYSKPNDNAPKTRADNVFDGDGSTGWMPGARKATRLQLVVNLSEPITKTGKLKLELLFERHYTVSLGRFRISTTAKENAKANNLSEEAETILATVPQEAWSKSQHATITREFLLVTPLLKDARKKLDEARKAIPNLHHTMVMQEKPEGDIRQTFRHHRGEWLSPKEVVEPGLPKIFLEDSAEGSAPTNRLELARWLVSDANPLAARVAVNRAWREFFGAGLMRTNGDFGVQATSPTHPELLDWLALQYQNEMAWSTKALHRLIVTSATYQQSSERNQAELDSDPDNRLLARGPHFRMTGEMVRDVALSATGTLSTKMYGRGVRPPQPKSVTALAYGNQGWKVATGPDRYRRSIYTFRKRTAAFAAYTVFDGPTGEACTAKRNRSNTPLQALTVLNDAMFLELAQKMAAKLIDSQTTSGNAKPMTDEDAIQRIFKCFLTRPASDDELAGLLDYFQAQLGRLKAKELNSTKIGGKGATPRQAALAMVARVIMNLDETVTKR